MAAPDVPPSTTSSDPGAAHDVEEGHDTRCSGHCSYLESPPTLPPSIVRYLSTYHREECKLSLGGADEPSFNRDLLTMPEVLDDLVA